MSEQRPSSQAVCHQCGAAIATASPEWTRGIQVWDLRRLRAELAALNLDWDTPPSATEKDQKSK